MKSSNDKVIFHIDVNSAFLSWEAADRLQHGEKVDLREVPAVVGGDPVTRHGIVLAKSIPAKKYKIQTGETIFSARTKCSQLIVVPPHYDLYMKCSNAMVQVLNEYTPLIQRFSVDECFLDFSNTQYLYEDYIELAYGIKNRISKELGFTVNIGISSNKLLAKMASDFTKPDKVHTLFPEEVREKMWPLPVKDLFMVGRATLPKLNKFNIFTIGDLAQYDVDILKSRLKSHGLRIWKYANGIDNSEVRKSNYINMKGIGNSATIAFDVENREEAHKVLLSLCETVAMRLRNSGNCCGLIGISFRNNEFSGFNKQKKLSCHTDCTRDIFNEAVKLFDCMWNKEPLRNFGVYLSDLCTNEFYQVTLFEDKNTDRNKALDRTIDCIRTKYGSTAVIKAASLYSGIKPMMGGVGEDSYPVMSSIL